MIDTVNDEAWDEACKKDANARGMRYKSWQYYDSWVEIFGKDRANGTQAEDFHDAMNGILHAETEPQSPMDINLEDIHTPYTPVNDEEATTSVCEPVCSSSTKHTKKGKRKAMDGIIGPIMEGINNFTDKTDSRLGEIVGKMGHEYQLTRKCGDVFELINQIDDLTLDEKLVATNIQILTITINHSDPNNIHLYLSICMFSYNKHKSVSHLNLVAFGELQPSFLQP